MNPEHEDTELRDHFQALRREDAHRAPAFGRMVAPAPVRRHIPWIPLAAAALLVLAAGVRMTPAPVVVSPSPATVNLLIDSRLSDWQASSDDWLALPGRDWLSEAPSFDTSIEEITASRVFDVPSFEETQTEEDEV